MTVADSFGGGDIEPLILRALVRTLVAKGVLSEGDVRALLLRAVEGLVVEGSALSAAAAQAAVDDDLAPRFLGR